MCALLTACDRLPLPSGLVPHDFVGCTRALHAELASPAAVTFSLTLRECGLRASSCGELRSCALRGAKVDVCAGRGKAGPVDMCDGDGRAITCNAERVTLVRDCPRGGEQCVVQEGHAVCALGSCEKDAAPGVLRLGNARPRMQEGQAAQPRLRSVRPAVHAVARRPQVRDPRRELPAGDHPLRGGDRGGLLPRSRGAGRLRSPRARVWRRHRRPRRSAERRRRVRGRAAASAAGRGRRTGRELRPFGSAALRRRHAPLVRVGTAAGLPLQVGRAPALRLRRQGRALRSLGTAVLRRRA